MGFEAFSFPAGLLQVGPSSYTSSCIPLIASMRAMHPKSRTNSSIPAHTHSHTQSLLMIYAEASAAFCALAPLSFWAGEALTGLPALRMAEARATASLRRSGR
jgi:hypothetical protein